MWIANKINATGAWCLIIEFLSSISSKAAGIILKLAAIGVNNVPQYPAVNAKAPAIATLAPCENTNGIPIPTVITENAAKAFPIIIVNKAIALQEQVVDIPINRFVLIN